ncbi:alkaline shock response membrane anchor protein AmaP [Streptomyces bambusae]|uniref:Asp23/Gls24 family envelope stress response protein n=1 Tax=Streptomyces bambusae TaxID=1550616 RepID=UPI001CFE22F6|nr:alkaline shock response membrane anchor protein AmaP [Streptomyces bambusae]MCB5168123.1 alkaline shock response membrane anchor protein AmaP [Streptomyces bambusae]
MTTPAARPSRAARIAPADRGATRIADRVVARIAAQAAKEALGAPAPGSAAPHASVTVHHDIARVRISLELGYPSDIGARCAAVRRHVAERIEQLAGMAVPEVDIDVEHLHSVHARPTARARLR